MTEPLKILFLTARFPYPLIGGDRIKPYYLLSHLAKKHKVTLVTFFQGKKPPEEYVRHIKSLGIELFVIPLNSIKAGLNTLLSLHKYPLEIGYYTQPDFTKTIKKLTTENNFDLAFSFFMRTAEYIKDLPIKKILIAEDCRTTYQKRSYEETTNIKQKAVRYWEYIRLSKYEPNIVNSFNCTTLVTNEDIHSMKERNSKAEYRLLTNGVEISKFVPPANTTQRRDILFAGKLDVWANVLMIQNNCQRYFPFVKIKIS